MDRLAAARARAARVITLSLAIVFAPPALATDAQAPLRLLWLGGDAELLERVRGQLSDLRVEISAVDGALAEATMASTLVRVRELGRQHAAAVAVWTFEQEEGRTAVAVADLRDDRLFMRTVRGKPGGNAAAAHETVALVIRSAVKVLSQGGTIGVHIPHDPVPTSPWRWSFGGGWQWLVDGASRRGLQGPALRLALGRGSWEGGLLASSSLPGQVRDDLATALISRHTLAVQGGWGRSLRGWELRGAGYLGLVLVHRSTVDTAPGLQPSPPSWHRGTVVGAEVRLTWSALGLVAPRPFLAVGAEASRPRLTFTYAGVDRPERAMRLVSLRVTLGLSLEVPTRSAGGASP